ncbi:hypothetical protein ILYODFUR_019840 [Ilyodon furcidens]|uniref:Uncharacterized protein n=1 Tax=Ilyodon furcidens TaxID=33524 RepID=A0ABV0T157_9TELE
MSRFAVCWKYFFVKLHQKPPSDLQAKGSPNFSSRLYVPRNSACPPSNSFSPHIKENQSKPSLTILPVDLSLCDTAHVLQDNPFQLTMH